MVVARCTVERLMRQTGQRGTRRDKATRSMHGDSAEIAELAGLAKRAFVAGAPNRLWVADFTDIRSHSGWVYASYILDVYSRRAVGWQTSTNMRTDLALDALDMGLGTPPSRARHHQPDPSQRDGRAVPCDSLHRAAH
ncbi:DDE-type integrase/transposase/recombinase [Agromyces sp. NPDC058136]|uniref:DDE-type integrase/transposase/recombinase n=1 Tax=Agromyces sp. NPDC058136 TaxID=3346354 RepID=UPI0036D7B681